MKILYSILKNFFNNSVLATLHRLNKYSIAIQFM